MLPNGLRLLTIETPHLHSASICLYVRAGSRYETAARRTASRTSSSTCCSAGSARYPSSFALNLRHRGAGRHALRRDGARLLALPDRAAPAARGARPGDPRRSVRGARVPRHRARAADHPRGDPRGSRRARAQRQHRRHVARSSPGTTTRSAFRITGPLRNVRALHHRRRAPALPRASTAPQHGAVRGRAR